MTMTPYIDETGRTNNSYTEADNQRILDAVRSAPPGGKQDVIKILAGEYGVAPTTMYHKYLRLEKKQDDQPIQEKLDFSEDGLEQLETMLRNTYENQRSRIASLEAQLAAMKEDRDSYRSKYRKLRTQLLKVQELIEED